MTVLAIKAPVITTVATKNSLWTWHDVFDRSAEFGPKLFKKIVTQALYSVKIWMTVYELRTDEVD